MFVVLLPGTVSASNHINCMYDSKVCVTQPTLIYLHPNE